MGARESQGSGREKRSWIDARIYLLSVMHPGARVALLLSVSSAEAYRATGVASHHRRCIPALRCAGSRLSTDDPATTNADRASQTDARDVMGELDASTDAVNKLLGISPTTEKKQRTQQDLALPPEGYDWSAVNDMAAASAALEVHKAPRSNANTAGSHGGSRWVLDSLGDRWPTSPSLRLRSARLPLQRQKPTRMEAPSSRRCCR